LLDAARQADAHHRSSETIVSRVLTTALTLPLHRRKHRAPIRFDDIVRADLRTGRGDALTATIYGPY
jgi:hypothetical protein